MAETIIYLDHAATSPVHPDVLEAMLPYLSEGYGNPGSLHRVGSRARHAVHEAREHVAALIGASASEIIFTAGGTEADNLAIGGVLQRRSGALITSPTEHHAVLHAAQHYAAGRGGQKLVSVDDQGRVQLDTLAECLEANTGLVSVMHGNNETGVLQPVSEIALQCDQVGVPYHCDGVQSVGHLPVDVSTWPVALLSLSAHKIGGPKGVGALYVRKGTPIAPLIFGGAQERGQRAGTENVAGIVGFGKACERARETLPECGQRYRALCQRLERGIIDRLKDCWVNSGEAERLPHIVNVGVAGVEGEGILYGLDAEGICVSTGSACTAGVADPSHVLCAMGQSEVDALAALRFSVGHSTTEADVDRVLNVLSRVVQELRA